MTTPSNSDPPRHGVQREQDSQNPDELLRGPWAARPGAPDFRGRSSLPSRALTFDSKLALLPGVTIPLRSGGARGTYLVSYRIISADTHPVGGSITYSPRRPQGSVFTLRLPAVPACGTATLKNASRDTSGHSCTHPLPNWAFGALRACVPRPLLPPHLLVHYLDT